MERAAKREEVAVATEAGEATEEAGWVAEEAGAATEDTVMVRRETGVSEGPSSEPKAATLEEEGSTR